MKKLFTILLLMCSVVVMGQSYNTRFLKRQAKAGDATYQTLLGTLYYSGTGGVERDYNEAIKWFRKAADQGNLNAQTFMGLCYYSGRGVSKDYNIAFEWFRKSARRGNFQSMFGMGLCYYQGDGVAKDYNKAVEWFSKSVEQDEEGWGLPRLYLADCYRYGYGVSKDLSKAKEYYEFAANKGDDEAKDKLIEVEREIYEENARKRDAALNSSSKNISYSDDKIVLGVYKVTSDCKEKGDTCVFAVAKEAVVYRKYDSKYTYTISYEFSGEEDGWRRYLRLGTAYIPDYTEYIYVDHNYNIYKVIWGGYDEDGNEEDDEITNYMMLGLKITN